MHGLTPLQPKKQIFCRNRSSYEVSYDFDADFQGEGMHIEADHLCLGHKLAPRIDESIGDAWWPSSWRCPSAFAPGSQEVVRQQKQLKFEYFEWKLHIVNEFRFFFEFNVKFQWKPWMVQCWKGSWKRPAFCCSEHGCAEHTNVHPLGLKA